MNGRDGRLRFEILAITPRGRRGRLHTPHGVVETPAFMPVGTQGAIKAILPDQLRATGTSICLANTFHLHLRPGGAVVAAHGGLHGFMRWDGPILTDSGGFQIFSLGDQVSVDEEGATFASPIDGRRVRLTPEEAMAVQADLGADIVMAFDHLVPNDRGREVVEDATARSLRWLDRCIAASRRHDHHDHADQALFGIVQGGIYEDLRERSARELVERDLPGYAIGGLSVGERLDEMTAVLERTLPLLPEAKPRYLMGVGTVEDIRRAVALGVDLFDCVLPTRNARNGMLFTAQGPLRIRNARYREDLAVIEEGCDCAACAGGFSRAYLRHLLAAGEIAGLTLATIHNLRHYQRSLEGIRLELERG